MQFESKDEYDRYHNGGEERGQKAIIGFITGLLIGVLLIWVFFGDFGPRKQDVNEQAIQACIDNGGVPILGTYEKIADCKKI